MIEEEIKWVAIPFATDSLEASRLVDNYLYHIKSCHELEYIQHQDGLCVQGPKSVLQDYHIINSIPYGH